MVSQLSELVERSLSTGLDHTSGLPATGEEREREHDEMAARLLHKAWRLTRLRQRRSCFLGDFAAEDLVQWSYDVGGEVFWGCSGATTSVGRFFLRGCRVVLFFVGVMEFVRGSDGICSPS